MYLLCLVHHWTLGLLRLCWDPESVSHSRHHCSEQLAARTVLAAARGVRAPYAPAVLEVDGKPKSIGCALVWVITASAHSRREVRGRVSCLVYSFTSSSVPRKSSPSVALLCPATVVAPLFVALRELGYCDSVDATAEALDVASVVWTLKGLLVGRRYESI